MKFTCVLPFIIPIMLTACADNTASESISASDSLPITETVALESAESDTSDTEIADSAEITSDTDTNYTGICGEVFEPEMFKEDPDAVLNMYLYYRTDYGYTALFDGKTYNSFDNPEKFDLAKWECTEQCEAASGGYFIINKGDKIGNLTCTDAFAKYYINEVYDNSFGLMSSSVCFEGEIKVTGYVDRYDGNEGYVEEGELHFYPDGESWQEMPIEYNSRYLLYSLKDERLIYAPFRISLGVVSDYSALDLERDIPQGSTAHMKLVLKDLQLNYVNTNFGSYTISTATIVSAEKID